MAAQTPPKRAIPDLAVGPPPRWSQHRVCPEKPKFGDSGATGPNRAKNDDFELGGHNLGVTRFDNQSAQTSRKTPIPTLTTPNTPENADFRLGGQYLGLTRFNIHTAQPSRNSPISTSTTPNTPENGDFRLGGQYLG